MDIENCVVDVVHAGMRILRREHSAIVGVALLGERHPVGGVENFEDVSCFVRGQDQ